MKTILEFIPLVAFFFTFKEYGLITATVILAILTIISVAILYCKTKKLSAPLLISAIVVSIFAFLTWYFDNPIFIKIKPTLVNSIFAAALFAGVYLKKPFLKHLLGGGLELPEKAWYSLAIRFAIFFIFMALLNEVIWRNFSEDFWVKFKVFGFLPISITFTISQMPFILRQQKYIVKK